MCLNEKGRFSSFEFRLSTKPHLKWPDAAEKPVEDAQIVQFVEDAEVDAEGEEERLTMAVAEESCRNFVQVAVVASAEGSITSAPKTFGACSQSPPWPMSAG